MSNNTIQIPAAVRPNRSIYYYLVAYFVVMHVVPLTNVVFGKGVIDPALVVGVASVFPAYLAICRAHRVLHYNQEKMSLLDLFVFVFLFYSIFSFIQYLHPDNPASFSGYFFGFYYTIVPMFLFFTVKKISLEQQNNLVKIICYLNLFFVVVGLIFFFLQPTFYTNYLIKIYEDKGIVDMWQLYGRLQSYLGSTSVGVISSVMIVLVGLVHMRFEALFFLIMLSACFLSGQRGAIFTGLIAVIYYLFCEKKLRLRRTVALCVGLTIIICLLQSAFQHAFQDEDYLKGVTINMIGKITQESALSERVSGYTKGWDFVSKYPFGLGVGATLSATDSAGVHPDGQVVDANYMRILADLGFWGLGIFWVVIFFALRAAYLNKRSFGWMLIILIYCMQAVGTNIFDSYYVIHCFWLFLGIIDSGWKNNIAPRTQAILTQ